MSRFSVGICLFVQFPIIKLDGYTVTSDSVLGEKISAVLYKHLQGLKKGHYSHQRSWYKLNY